VVAVERNESFKGGSEDLRCQSDFGFARCERVHASSGGLIEGDGETLHDFALPKEFENLVRVRGNCESSLCGSAVFIHHQFVTRYFCGIVFLDVVNEQLANAFHLVLPRQAEESSKPWVRNVLLKEERPNTEIRREIHATHHRYRAAHS
jgi:hypothetical protein